MIKNSTKRAEFFVFGFYFIQLANTVLQIINTVQPENISSQFISISVQPSHILSFDYNGITLTNQYMSSIQPYPNQKNSLSIPGLSGPTKVRSWIGNSNTTKNAQFMYFTKYNHFHSINATVTFSNPTPGFLQTNQILLDIIYGNNTSQQFAVIKNFSNNTYRLSYIENNLERGSLVLFQANQSTYCKIKHYANKNKIIVVFSKYLYVLTADKFLLEFLKFIGYPFQAQYHDSDLSPDNLMAIMLDDFIQFYNITTCVNGACYQLVSLTQAFPTPLTSVKFISNTQILISTNMQLMRCYVTNTPAIKSYVIQTMHYPQSNYYSVQLINDNIAVVYADGRPSFAYYIICLVKSCYMPPSPLPSEKGYFQSINNQSVRAFSKSMANSMAFCSLKITPNMLTILPNTVDDLWFYKYHIFKNTQSYPSTVQYFLQQADYIGFLKSNPSFMRIISFFSDSTVAVQENNHLIRYFNFTRQRDLDKAYFLNASQDTYKSNLLMNIILFGFIKLFHLLFYYLQNRWEYFQSIYNVIKMQSKWWTFIVGMIQVNMAKLSFYVAIQFRYFSFHTSFDKFNQIVSVIVIACLVLYSLCFYPLAHIFAKKSQRKQIADILLIRCRCEQKSFIFESFLVVFRNLFRSFIHGYFIFFQANQILILFLIDVVYFVVIIKMKHLFKHYSIFYLILVYNLFYLGLDGYFTLEQFFGLYKSSDRELVGLVAILSIFTNSILLSLVLLIFAIFQLISKYIEKTVNKKLQQMLNSAKYNKILLSSIENENEQYIKHSYVERKSLIKNLIKLKKDEKQQKNQNAKKQNIRKKQILVKIKSHNNKIADENYEEKNVPICTPSTFQAKSYIKMKKV